jgi:hypothetical protein
MSARLFGPSQELYMAFALSRHCLSIIVRKSSVNGLPISLEELRVSKCIGLQGLEETRTDVDIYTYG